MVALGLMIQILFTFVQIKGLLGFLKKSSTSAFSPIARTASGKYDLNQASTWSALWRRSSSADGANKVQVNVLSCDKNINERVKNKQ